MAISKITVKLDPEQMEHIRKEFLDVLEAQRAKLDKAREALNNMICEAQLQDAFGDDEGMAILDNARRALAELKD